MQLNLLRALTLIPEMLRPNTSSLLLLCLLISGLRASAHDLGSQPMSRQAGISFVENRGQWEDVVRYKAEVPGGAMFLTDRGFAYAYTSQEDLSRIHEKSLQDPEFDENNAVVRHHAYYVHFAGGNTAVSYSRDQKRTAYHNYFLSNDRSKWAGGVPLYGKIVQHDVYAGIDAVIYSQTNTIKYEFLVAAGADPNQIALKFEGVAPELTPDGDLKITTSVNEIIEKAPYSYQQINGQTVEVASRYKLKGDELSFEFPNGYNTHYPLIIDPTLIFATYSGGTSGPYYAHSTTYGKNGVTYAAGLGVSTGWPTTAGAFQSVGNAGGSQNVCINKYDSVGANLIYSTYYSGNSYTVPNVMRENPSGELVLAGATNAPNLPVTAGAYDSTLNGGADLYVAHFNADGTDLIGATYIGSSGTEPALLDIQNGSGGNALANASATSNPVEIAFDSAGNIWISSNTSSATFPVTPDALQSTHAGLYDGVLFKLDPSCSNLLYSTFLGGSANDGIFMLEFINNQQIVLVGGTKSTDFPTTPGVLHPTAPGGGDDGFVSIFDLSTNSLVASSYLGTADQDNATKVQVGDDGNIYVLGRTLGNYPITPGVWSMPNTDVYIDVLTPDLTSSVRSTRLGKTQGSSLSGAYLPSAFLLDICGNVYVAGLTSGSTQGLPTTPDAFEVNARPFWFCVLKPNFTDILFGSYFGTTSDHHHAGASHFSPEGVVYHSTCSTNGSYPTTTGAYSEDKMGMSNDVISFKFDFEATGVRSHIALPLLQNDTVCVPGTVQFANNSTSPYPMEFLWDFGDGNTSTAVAPTHTFTDTGVYQVVLHAHSDSACVPDSWDTLILTVLRADVPDITVNDTTICDFNQAIDLQLTINNPSENNSVYWGPTAAIVGSNDSTTVTVNPFVSNLIVVTVRDSIPNICGFSVTDTILINKTFLDYLPYVEVRSSCIGRANGFAWINTMPEDTLSYTCTWRSDTDTFTMATGDSLLNVPSGNYNVFIQASNGCDTTLYFFLPYEAYYADFITSDTIICEGETIDFTNHSDDHFEAYYWDFADQSGSNVFEPQHRFDSGGVYRVMLAATGPICSDTTFRTIIVDAPIQEGFALRPEAICVGDAVSLEPLSDSTTTRIGWQLGGANFRWEHDLNIAYQHAFDAPGIYAIELTRLSRACPDQTWTDSISVLALPLIDLGPDSALCLDGAPVLLTNLQEQPAGMRYDQWWNTGDSTKTLAVTQPGTYTLTVSSQPLGCTNTETVVINKDCYLDIPNAFTPNADGHNDYFLPRQLLAKGVRSFRMQIFNRWGQLMFETSDPEGRGWDGKFNGQDQPVGVYLYSIEVGFINGQNEHYRGNLTIIR